MIEMVMLRERTFMWSLGDLRYLSKNWVCCGVRVLGKDFITKTTSQCVAQRNQETMLKSCCGLRFASTGTTIFRNMCMSRD